MWPGADDGLIMNDIKYKFGTPTTLPKNAFVRKGYKFVSWTTGTKNYSYKDGEKVTYLLFSLRKIRSFLRMIAALRTGSFARS